jgi:hypothetical protein
MILDSRQLQEGLKCPLVGLNMPTRLVGLNMPTRITSLPRAFHDGTYIAFNVRTYTALVNFNLP